MKKWAFLVLVAAVPVRSAWYGAVGKAVPRDGHSIEFIYDTGSRELEEDKTNAKQKLSSHGFLAQYSRGLGQGFELLFRGSPSTSRVNFAGSSFNPDVWSVGGGIHWAPPEPLGPVRVGLITTVDYADGRNGSKNTMNAFDFGVAAGATYPLPRDLSVTGGVAMVKSSVSLKKDDVKTDFGLEQEVGGFAGAGWSPNDAWNVSTEFHFGNERVWGVSARYNFQ